MRSKNINPDGTGNGPLSDFINRVLERFKELQFYSSDTVTVEQTTRGTRFHARIPPPPPAAATTSMFAITELGNAEYFTARTWDGKVFGTQDIFIAKPPRQRMTVEYEVIDGETINYSEYTDDNVRTATSEDGTDTEQQLCYPRFVTMLDLDFSGYLDNPPIGEDADTFNVSQCIIFATQPANGTGVMTDEDNPKPVTWLEISPGRVWAKTSDS